MLRVETTGYGDARRIMEGDELVGMAMKYTNGAWAPHSIDDKKLGPAIHKTPSGVRKWFDTQRNG